MKTRFLGMCMVLLMVLGCRQEVPQAAARPIDLAELERDLRLVVVEATMNRRFSEPGSVILVRTPTTTHRFLEFDELATEEHFVYQVCQPDIGIGQLQPETAKNFIVANQSSHRLTASDFGGADWMRVVDSTTFEGYWAEGRSTKEGWQAVLSDYPSAIGYVEISAFGWSSDRSEGLVYAGSLTTTGVGGGEFYALRRHGSQYSCDMLMGAPKWMTQVRGGIDHVLPGVDDVLPPLPR